MSTPSLNQRSAGVMGTSLPLIMRFLIRPDSSNVQSYNDASVSQQLLRKEANRTYLKAVCPEPLARRIRFLVPFIEKLDQKMSTTTEFEWKRRVLELRSCCP